MKRTAETQLTKDNADNTDDNEEGQGGFKKADADSLATRKIKGLPKRLSEATGGPQPASTNNASSGSSRFAAFSGFGSMSSSKDKDDIKSTPILPASIPSFAGFGSTTTSGFSFGTKPSEMQKASTSSLFSTSSTPRSDSSSAMTPNPTQKFFIDIRGLNHSYLKTIRESIEKDPFVDLSSTVENYRTLREGIQRDYDSNKSKQTQQTPDTNSVPAVSSMVPKTFSMPTPPAQFSFQAPTTAAPQATSAPVPSSSSWPASTTSTEKPSMPTFSFGAPNSSSSGFFVFGSKTGGTSTSAAETAEEKQTPETVDKPASSSQRPPMPSFKSSSAPITPGFSSFLTSSSSSTPSSLTPSVLFGSSPTATPTTNNGNIGNPLGFSFGSTPAFSTSATTSSAPTTSDLVKPPAKEDAPETDGDEGTSESVGEGTKEDPVNPFDKESAGEEDEETLFETKSRAYISITTEDNKKVWSPAGSGQLKLKKLKEGARRRLLMRNSSNGKIIINTLIVPSFKLTVDGKTISFIVPSEDGSANLFRLRLATEAEAKEWETKVFAK